MQSHAQTPLFSQDSCPVRLEMGVRFGLSSSTQTSPGMQCVTLRRPWRQSRRAPRPKLALALGGARIGLMEVRRISSLLRDGFKAAIIGIESTPEAIHRYAETAFKMPMIAPRVDTRPRMPLVFTGAPFAEVEDEPEDEAVPTDLPDLQGDVVEQDDADEAEVEVLEEADAPGEVTETTIPSAKSSSTASQSSTYSWMLKTPTSSRRQTPCRLRLAVE